MKRVLSAFGSLLALVLFFVGLPVVLLSAVGWPIPDVATVRSAFELRYLPSHLVAQTGTCAALLCWAWLLVAALRMGVAAWRDRSVRPAFGTAWLSPLVKRAVAALVLCAGLLSQSPAWSATANRPAAGSVVTATVGRSADRRPARASRSRVGLPSGPGRLVDDEPDSHDHRSPVFRTGIGGPRTGTADAAPASAGRAVYRVQAGDFLWNIAADQLHDPLQWSRIWELNRGRMLVDSDGGHRVFTDPKLILPGWELLMPSGWSPAMSPPATPRPAGVPGVTGGAPETTRQPPPPVPPVAISPAAAPVTSGPTSTGPTTSTAPIPTVPAGPASSAAGAGQAATRPPRPKPVLTAVTLPGWLVPAGGGGAALLATWALVEAQRRRARRLRQSRPGFVMPPSDPTVTPVTAAVRAASDTATVDRVEAALYHLATVGDNRLRPVVLLRHPDGRIDVQLFSVAEPVAPWTATDKLFWTLEPSAELPRPDALVTPCPALVQIGVCDDGAQLFVDLEAIGILGLTGTAETVRQVARALTATLAVSPATHLCRVLTLGFDPSGLSDVDDRFVVARSVESLLHEAEMTAKPVVRGIAERDAGSSFRLRAIDPDCGWEPTMVVVAGITLANDEIARLERLAGEGGQGAAVVCAGADAAWSLQLVDPAAGWWQLNPLGLRVRPVQMAADELRELAAYLADADMEPVEMSLDVDHHLRPSDAAAGRADGEELLGAERADPEGAEDGEPAGAENVEIVDHREAGCPPLDGTAHSSAAAELVAAPARPDLRVPPNAGGSLYVEPEWTVMIRLFGPPDAVNRDGVRLDDAGRDKPLELLAWLVTHRDTATRSGAKEALWGGDEIAGRTMSNALWGARKLLRTLADEPDEEFITRSGGRLLLSSTVVSDYELVADRLRFARRQVDRAAATEALAGGLHLVRGAPLAGETWLWADENHLSTNLAMLGTAIATDLAAQRLKAGQTETAIDATTVGLEVIPNNEELIRLRMQACIDGGDRRAALNVYEKYVGATVARGETIGPAIAALRNELLRAGRK